MGSFWLTTIPLACLASSTYLCKPIILLPISDAADADRSDMDEYLFGSTQLADQAFNLSILIFERIVQHVTSEIDGDEVGSPITAPVLARGPLIISQSPS